MLKRVCKCSPASKLVYGFLASSLHTKFITHYTIHHFVLATKQTLLSILLANHALLETYLQDEDSQMDTIETQGTTGEFTTCSLKNEDCY